MIVVGAGVLLKALVEQTRGRWAPATGTSPTYIGLWDSKLVAPDLADIAQYAESARRMFAQIAHQSPAEGFDCEDFALMFAGVSRLSQASRGAKFSAAVGFAIGRFSWRNEEHCCNWIAHSDSSGGIQLSWFEPQDLLGEAKPLALRSFKTSDFGSLKILAG